MGGIQNFSDSVFFDTESLENKSMDFPFQNQLGFYQRLYCPYQNDQIGYTS